MADIFSPSSPLTSLQPSSPPAHPFNELPTSPPPYDQSEHGQDHSPVTHDNKLSSTPVKKRQQGFNKYAASPAPLANKLYSSLDTEMRQSFMGPISAEAFLKDFLPALGFLSPSSPPGFKEMAKATCETDMYKPFVRLSIPSCPPRPPHSKSFRSTPSTTSLPVSKHSTPPTHRPVRRKPSIGPMLPSMRRSQGLPKKP